MRARHPDQDGFVDRDGTRIHYQVYGNGEPTVLLMPTWTIIHSRFWKLQIPYLARHFRVITYDGPGNGRSDRSLDPHLYRSETQASLAHNVLEATATHRAVLVSLSKAALWSLHCAVDRPDRVLGQVFIGPTLPLTPTSGVRARIPQNFQKRLDNPQGWEKYNAHYWRTNYQDFSEFFFSQCFPERHSTKPREDCVGWAMETGPGVLLADARSEAGEVDRETVLGLCRSVTGPVLVIHGEDDRISPLSRGEELAEATGGILVVLEGSGHIPLARDPVKVNLLIKEFVDRLAPRQGMPA